MAELKMHRAERKRAKIRVGVFGPSGAGKTMSALLLANGIAPWEKICVIDTENGSADLYEHLGPYQVICIEPPYEPEKYVQAIKLAEKNGMEVIVVDSISHEWDGTGGMLDINTALIPQFKDGKLIWQKITPRHNAFIDAIKFSVCHVICCGRSKTDVVLNQKKRDQITTQEAEKIGLKAITREGFEYEMTVAFDLAINHYATCTKDRTTDASDGRAIFQDRPAFRITQETGQKIKAWSETGTADATWQKREIARQLKRLGYDLRTPEMYVTTVRLLTGIELEEAAYQQVIDALSAMTPEDAAGKKPPAPPIPPAAPPLQATVPANLAAEAAAVPPVMPAETASVAKYRAQFAECKTEKDIRELEGSSVLDMTVTLEDSDAIRELANRAVEALAAAAPKPKGAGVVMNEYRERVNAAATPEEVDAIAAAAAKDPEVVSSSALPSVIRQMCVQRIAALAGKELPPPPPPEVEMPAPAPAPAAAPAKKKKEPKKPTNGICGSCNGLGHTGSGADCAACDGSGLV